MRSQWECLLQNLGVWQGSFTRLSPQGEVIEDIPSETSLLLKDDRKTMRQVVRRFHNGLDHGQPQDLVLEYSSLNKNTVFFENGAFSQGSLQFSPYGDFGAELGLIYGDRRLRLVALYNPQSDRPSQLERFTLIREHLPQSQTPERPPLTLAALLGKWEGTSITLAADWLMPESVPTQTECQQEGDRVIMNLTMPTNIGNQTITSTAHVDPLNPNVLNFDQDHSLSMQTVFVGDGASITCPKEIASRQAFQISLSWLLERSLHQRLIRTYDCAGSWTSLSLVTERKLA
jgi:hypothetical protein